MLQLLQTHPVAIDTALNTNAKTLLTVSEWISCPPEPTFQSSLSFNPPPTLSLTISASYAASPPAPCNSAPSLEAFFSLQLCHSRKFMRWRKLLRFPRVSLLSWAYANDIAVPSVVFDFH
jgi:hypothetical protein